MSRYPFSGWALPYDVVTKRDFYFWRFEQRSIVFPGAVRLLRDHDNAQEFGRVFTAERRTYGLWTAGESREEIPEGMPLSIGFEVIRERRENGVRVIEEARLIEVSVVKRSAYAAARTERTEAA